MKHFCAFDWLMREKHFLPFHISMFRFLILIIENIWKSFCEKVFHALHIYCTHTRSGTRAHALDCNYHTVWKQAKCVPNKGINGLFMHVSIVVFVDSAPSHSALRCNNRPNETKIQNSNRMCIWRECTTSYSVQIVFSKNPKKNFPFCVSCKSSRIRRAKEKPRFV